MAATLSLSSEAIEEVITTGDVQGRQKEILQLNPAQISELLTTQLYDMKAYFREPISTIRTGQCLAESTIDTTVRRVMSKHVSFVHA